MGEQAEDYRDQDHQDDQQDIQEQDDQAFFIHCSDVEEHSHLVVAQKIYRDRTVRNHSGRRRRSNPNAPHNYEKRLALRVIKRADRNDPDRLYRNSEFEVWVEQGQADDGNAGGWQGVGPMIHRMRVWELLSSPHTGNHKLHWEKIDEWMGTVQPNLANADT